MDKSKLGGALTVFGLAVFGIPAAIGSSGITIALPKWVLLTCMVSGLLIVAAGHFCNTVFPSSTDQQQQKQLNALKSTVDEQTKAFEKSGALAPIGPGKPGNQANPS